MIRLVATDLDGTLLQPDTSVSPRVAPAVAAARAAGITVVPITARPPQATWAIAAAAGFSSYAVCSNGAVVVDLASRELVAVELLGAAIAARIVEQVRAQIPGIVCAIDGHEHFFHEPGFFTFPPFEDEPVSECPDVLDHLGDGVVKLIARLDHHTSDQLIAMLEAVVGEEAHVTSSGADWVELSAYGVTKAFALERVCDLLGVSIDEVLAVGDNLNDLPMLAWAGVGASVANARPEVLAVTDWHLPANVDHGVPQLLESLATHGTWPPPDR